MTANVNVPTRSDGSNHIADVGETSRLAGICYDEQDPANELVGSAITDFRFTLQDEATGQIINDRDQVDIRSILNPDGSWELLLEGDDNVVVDPTQSVEFHIATIAYVYVNTSGGSSNGEQRFRLQVAPGVILIPDPEGPVNLDGSISGPLYVGDSYLTANKNAFTWWVAAPPGYTAGGATPTFRSSVCPDVTGWSVTGTVVEDTTYGLWRITVEMTAAETGVITPGQWGWALEISEGSARTTLKSGVIQWVEV